MLVEDIGAHVGPIAHDLLWNVVREEVGDPAVTERVRAFARRTLRGFVGSLGGLTRLRQNPNLSEADVAAIALAAREDDVAVIDERYGRATADTEGVETRGTVSILVAAVRARQLSSEQAVDVLDAMIDAGWYCSTDLYTRIVRRLRSLA